MEYLVLIPAIVSKYITQFHPKFKKLQLKSMFLLSCILMTPLETVKYSDIKNVLAI